MVEVIKLIYFQMNKCTLQEKKVALTTIVHHLHPTYTRREIMEKLRKGEVLKTSIYQYWAEEK